MTTERAGELISQNLQAIYGFAFARLFDKEKVDDLTSEIICEILTSANNIKNDEAFWGYIWRIADNTFKKFIRKDKKLCEVVPIDDDNYDAFEKSPSPEDLYLESEDYMKELYLLRRELSILTKVHREVCIAYYMDNKSCSVIAKEQKIGVEMVKYHLFKTRKLLKEGIGMTRQLGEKSYKPGEFRLNFWGDWNYYWKLFDKKLPGNILLSAYYTPVSAEELSLEMVI